MEETPEDKVVEEKVCRQCGDNFSITESEIAFFDKLKEDGKIKEVFLPAKCYGCRREAKKNRVED